MKSIKFSKILIAFIIMLSYGYVASASDDVFIVNENKLSKNNDFTVILNEKINNYSVDENSIYLSTKNFFYGINKTSGNIDYKVSIVSIQKIEITENYIYVTTYFNVYQIDKISGNIVSKYSVINNDIFTWLNISTSGNTTINNYYYDCGNCTNGTNGIDAPTSYIYSEKNFLERYYNLSVSLSGLSFDFGDYINPNINMFESNTTIFNLKTDLDMNTHPIYNLSELYSYTGECNIKFNGYIYSECGLGSVYSSSSINEGSITYLTEDSSTSKYNSLYLYPDSSHFSVEDFINNKYNHMYMFDDRYEFLISNAIDSTQIDIDIDGIDMNGDNIENIHKSIYQDPTYTYNNFTINSNGNGHNPVISANSCCGIHPILYYQFEGIYMAYMNKDYAMSYYTDKLMKYGESASNHVTIQRNSTNKSLIVQGHGDTTKVEFKNVTVRVNSLAGNDNALACLDSNGVLYRGNLTNC